MTSDNFFIQADIVYRPEPQYFVYDKDMPNNHVATIIIPDAAPARLRIEHDVLYDVFSHKAKNVTEVEMEPKGYTFVTPSIADSIVDYLNAISFLASKFIEEYRSKQKTYGFRLILNIPLDNLIKTRKFNERWKITLPETAKDVEHELELAANSLQASLYFADKCITRAQIRALWYFADSIEFMFEGDDLFKLHDKVSQVFRDTEQSMKPSCHLDNDSWVILNISEEVNR